VARVVFVNVGFPHSLDYPEALPLKLALQAGHEVHALSLVQDHPGFPGVQRWQERSMFRIWLRALRLRADLLFFERPGRLLVAAGLLPGRTWVRAPERVQSPVKRLMQSWLMGRVDVVTFTNPHERTLWNVPADKVRELPYPVDLEFWSSGGQRATEFWSQRSLPVPGVVIACVANLLERKQQPELVRWVAPLLRERPEAVLCFAGSEYDAGVAQRIRIAATEESVGAQVHILGYLGASDTRELFSWSDVHVVNSRNETQCMAMYEGLASGVATTLFDYPVLTSGLPSLPVHDGPESLYGNVMVFLAEADAGARQRAAEEHRLRWVSRAHHDEQFLITLDEQLRS
jgi:glycosyltransferase involved in cell wall biosynthesis